MMYCICNPIGRPYVMGEIRVHEDDEVSSGVLDPVDVGSTQA